MLLVNAYILSNSNHYKVWFACKLRKHTECFKSLKNSQIAHNLALSYLTENGNCSSLLDCVLLLSANFNIVKRI